MTQFLEAATDEIANANVSVLSKDVIKNALSHLLWNWYNMHLDVVLKQVELPIKFWKIDYTIRRKVTVRDARFLFELLAGPEVV